MHIKNILISGFRSYREQSFQTDLSPKNNVLVGKNGSGKSNVFAAIQFVLSEKFGTLTTAERKELFHVGSGRPALSIFVEIVFDNSDGRLIIPGRAEEKEVRIRRTMGLKQDEFRVNDRRFTATEVRQLLESAGFSSSNPYYVVEQGKIISLVNMSDEERCQLIKNVAGTKVYEARRKESEEMLEETSGKHKKIEESINQLETRLMELEVETAELKSLEEFEKERRCIEYTIFNLELANAEENLEKLDKCRKKYVLSLNEQSEADNNAKGLIEFTEAQIRDYNNRIAHLEGEMQALEKEATELNGKKAIAQLDAADASKTITRNEKERKLLENEMMELEKKSKIVKSNLESKRKTQLEQQAIVGKKGNELSNLEVKLEASLAKRGRRKLFKSKKERDAWIAEEIERNKGIIESHKEEVLHLNKSIENINSNIANEEKQQKEKETISKTVEAKLANNESRRAKAIALRNTLNIEKRTLWQKVNEQESTVQRLQDECSHLRHQVERVVPHDIRQGIQSLKEILHELADKRLTDSVYGQLIELIDVAKGYETAVEVTAGNTLFNVVIASFEVGAFLLEQINMKKKPGRITFFPLDTCKSEPIRFTGKENCTTLMDHIICDQKFHKVISEVFGKTAVIKSIEDGAKLSKQYNCDAVTLDGDQISRKGGITGGYLELRKMRLLAFKNEKILTEKLQSEKMILEKLCQDVAVVEHKITNVINEIESIKGEASLAENEVDTDLRDVCFHDERKLRLAKQREHLLDTRKGLEKRIAEAKKVLSFLQKEANDEFTSSWGKEEESHLESMMAEVDKCRHYFSQLQSQNVQLSTEVQLLNDTFQNIAHRINILKTRISELAWVNTNNQTLAREQVSVDEELSLVSTRLTSVQNLINEVMKEKHAAEEKLQLLKNKQHSSSLLMHEKRESDEQIQLQRASFIRRRNDAMEKIRGLGIVPKDAAKFSGKSLGMLMHCLKEVNNKLKTFSHVNRKAIDQYSSLLETKNDLVSQKENLQDELKSIYELIDHLDKKKDEAVERTFKQVQYQFEEVFKELVATPDCHGELQLVRSMAKKRAGEDPYIAARILVSFGLGTAVTELGQLSGGQKSLVALALIFAIQRCDPAPFYLFDEIDAALDAEYRFSVARLLKEESKNCQFITATFKTEMLEAADRVLGVFFHNKISRIQTISHEEGVKLLKQAALENRKRDRESE